ncbi:hypothetical protein [Micromonospora sp. NPDC003776]
MTHAPASLVLFLLGWVLLVLQPGGIALGYAVARRHRRVGGRHPVLVAIVGWFAGCLVTWLFLAPVGAALDHLNVDSTWLLILLSYLPVWLLAWLIARAAATVEGPSPTGPGG